MSVTQATHESAGSQSYQPDHHHQQPSGPWEFLADKLPAIDLTAVALSGAITPAVELPQPAANDTGLSGGLAENGDVNGNGKSAALPEPYASLARCLYRRTQGHVLLTGDDGVGKTTIVRELARLAAEGEIPFLTGLAVAGEQPERVRCCEAPAFVLRSTGPDVRGRRTVIE